LASDGCTVEPFDNLADAGFLLGESCDDLMVELSSTDELIAEDCPGGGVFFSRRTVIRTYTYESANGGFDETCPQTITYEFDACDQVSDAGRISLDGTSLIHVPSGCNAPAITELAEATVSGCNNLVEHMWLRSTVESSNGLPLFPTPLNVGPEGSGMPWVIVSGATDADLNPGIITQNTYFVRCTRSISCCQFRETNIVGIRIDDSAECPAVEEGIEGDQAQFERLDNCAGEIVLDGRDDMRSGDQKEYRTNQTIRATNKVGAGASTIYNAQDGIFLNPGFEVETNAELQAILDGCNN
jgi:hypothetical protein